MLGAWKQIKSPNTAMRIAIDDDNIDLMSPFEEMFQELPTVTTNCPNLCKELL